MPTKTSARSREQNILNGQISLFDLEPNTLFNAVEPAPTTPRVIVLNDPKPKPKATFAATTEDLLVKGAKSKIEASLRAAETLYQIELESRPATPQEKATMARYTAFGGLAKVFDPKAKDLGNLYEWIKNTLTPKDYESARTAAVNAFYTDLGIGKALWRYVQAMGFPGGRILEPAAAVGHLFSSMPADLRENSQISAVELDPLSGRLGKTIHDDVRYFIQGFQTTEFPENSFDLAISNVPFGNYPVFDKSFSKDEAFLLQSIHNYYFAKATKLVRPGGLIVFITSRHTLDSRTNDHRQWMAKNLTLLDAIRLPTGTFREFAGTDAIEDILIFKHEPDPQPNRWLEADDYELPSPHKDRIVEAHSISRYFLENPEKVLGTFQAATGPYGSQLKVINDDLDTIVDQIELALGEPAASYIPQEPTKQEKWLPIPENVTGLRDGSYYITHKGTFRKRGIVAEPVTYRGKTLANLQAQIDLARQARIVVHLCLNGSDAQLKNEQGILNYMYDMYVMSYGSLNDPNNRKIFSRDPASPLLRALEIYDTTLNTAKKTKIFSERTIRQNKQIQKTESALDALHLSINTHGCVDLDFISNIYGASQEQAIAELDDAIFFDPKQDRWILKDEYLSGNVNTKLNRAKALSADPRLARNIAALEAVQPKYLLPEEITVNLGATWIPEPYIKQFIMEMLDPSSHANNLDKENHQYRYTGYINWRFNNLRLTVNYETVLGRWIVSKNMSFSNIRQATEVWGTYRRDMFATLEAVLSGSKIEVYDEDSQGNRVLNKQETIAAKEKASKMREAFRKWVWKDPERAADLSEIYNKKFNVFVRRSYDGQHLHLPGTNPEIKLRPHQKDAVYRAITSDQNILLWHIVGSGKSFSLISSIMERKRLGLSQKPMLVLPTHLLEQMAVDFIRLYPAANILIVDSTSMSPQEKAETLARIATNDWDAVLINYSAFARIPLAPETWNSMLDQQLDEIENLLERMKHEEGKTVKELEKAKLRLKAKREAQNSKMKHDKIGLTWEELGVDFVGLDEAHSVKNLYFLTSRSHLPGIGGSESGMAFDMFLKTQYITRRCVNGHLLGSKKECYCGAERAPAGKIVFATGTAITNSISEMYTMQRFLQMDALIDAGIESFDAWASQFGDTETMLEMKPSGKGWRMNERFTRFFNVPDLMAMALQAFDCKIDPDALNLDRPSLFTKAPIPIEIKMSDEIKEYIEQCAKRAENLSRKDRSDNMLKIMHDALSASTDMRLIDRLSPDHPTSKINTMIDTVYEIWKRTTKVKVPNHDELVDLTQVVFLDLSTPKGENEFSLYQDAKQKWIERGIPAAQIAFAHDAKTDAEKKALYDRVNKGEVRIIMGTTAKLGTGVNMQRLLYAVHHVDAPWTPALVEQRDGRAWRQGNLNPEIAIYRYVVSGSLDFYKWHLLEVKAKFIRQLFTGANATQRTVEDLDQAVIGFAQMKALATGNPRVLEKVQIEAELTRLNALRSKFYDTRRSNQYELKASPNRLAAEESRQQRYLEMLHARDNYKGPRWKFGQIVCEERAAASKLMLEILNLLQKNEPVEQDVQIGPAQIEFITQQRVVLTRGDKDDYRIIAKFALAGHKVEIELSDSGSGSISRIENYLAGLEKDLEDARNKIEGIKANVETIKVEILKPFEHADKMRELEQKLIEIEAEFTAENKQAAATTEIVENDEEDEDDAPESANEDTKSKRGELVL